eukprot:m.591632 g.591632  ORF g.591632 m.591632 type:complete len:501 (-) comp58018_c0_seq3:367-1869(-)
MHAGRIRLGKRHELALLMFFGYFNLYSMRTVISVAAVHMQAEYNWSTQLKGTILGAFFYGYCVPQIPGGWLATKYGGKYVFGVGIIGSAIATLLTPVAASNRYSLIALLIISGLFQGLTLPAAYALWTKWAPPAERTTLAAFAQSGLVVGLVFCLLISSYLCNTNFLGGWPASFYTAGTLSLIWAFFWCMLTASSPRRHPRISREENDYISGRVLTVFMSQTKPRTPWKAIMTSLPAWALFINGLGQNWGFYVIQTELPSFLNDILQENDSLSGLHASFPYILEFAVLVFGGAFLDHLISRGTSRILVRKIFNTLASICAAGFLVAAGYVSSLTSILVFMTLSGGLDGFTYIGGTVNHLDITPRYAGITFAVQNTIGSIPGFVAPQVVGEVVSCTYCYQLDAYWEGNCPVGNVTVNDTPCSQSHSAAQWRFIRAPLSVASVLLRCFLLLTSAFAEDNLLSVCGAVRAERHFLCDVRLGQCSGSPLHLVLIMTNLLRSFSV